MAKKTKKNSKVKRILKVKSTKKSQGTNYVIKPRKLNNDYKFVLIDGTSSAGKSTICLYLKNKNYDCVRLDDYVIDSRINIGKDYFSKMKNEYNEKLNAYQKFDYDIVKLMIDDGIKSKNNILLDHVSQKEIIDYIKSKGMQKDLYIINVFGNLETLARNLESRRKEGDSRGMFPFEHFANRYIATTETEKNKIEKINRKIS